MTKNAAKMVAMTAAATTSIWSSVLTSANVPSTPPPLMSLFVFKFEIVVADH